MAEKLNADLANLKIHGSFFLINDLKLPLRQVALKQVAADLYLPSLPAIKV